MSESEFEIIAAEPSINVLEMAVKQGAGIETIERLVALQEKMLARQAEIAFNEALNRAQSEIVRVAPDLKNAQTSTKYASYAAIDKIIRPVYTKEGFSLSFSEEDCPKPWCDDADYLHFVSENSHAHLPQRHAPGRCKGAKGRDVMTKTHAVCCRRFLRQAIPREGYLQYRHRRG